MKLNLEEMQKALEEILTTDKEMSDKDLLGIATKILNGVYQSYGETKTSLPDDLLDRLITASLVLEKKKQENIIYLLMRALSSSQVKSEHLPIESLPFNVVQLILRALFASGAQDFHKTTAGETFARWLAEACSFVDNTEEFLEHFTSLLFPWGMHRYSCLRDKNEEKIQLQVDAHYIDAQTEIDDGLSKSRMALIMVHKEQEIAKITLRNPSLEEGDIQPAIDLQARKEEEYSDEDLTGFVDEDIEVPVAQQTPNLMKGISTSKNTKPKRDRKEDETEMDGTLSDEDSQMSQPTKKSKLSGAQRIKREGVPGQETYKRFPCPLCDEKFKFKKVRDKHCIQEHGQLADGNFQCHICNEKNIRSQDELVEHIDVHKRTCKQCSYVIPKGMAMKSHVEFHRAVKVSCQFCPKECTSRWDRRVHEYEMHSDIRPYACDECKFRFANKQSADDHQSIVHQKKKDLYQCDICQKKFDFSETLKRHKWNEHPRVGEKKHTCEDCGLKFRAAMKLMYHRIQQHGLKMDTKMKCVYCPEVFPNKRQLNMHKRDKHPGAELIIYCTDCTETFSNQAAMRRHYQEQHENDNVAENVERAAYPCSVCEKVFDTEVALAKHSQIVHQEVKVYQCDICAAILRSKTGFDNHVNQHLAPKQVLCHLCGKAFDSKRNCDRHVRKIHQKSIEERRKEKRFTCTGCNKQFPDRNLLIVHEQRKHLGNETYARQTCEYCAQTFTNVGTLKHHIESVHEGKHRGKVQARKPCPVCQKELALSSIKEHMQHAHGIGCTAFQCSHCKRYFHTLENLQLHCEKPHLCTKKRRREAGQGPRPRKTVVHHHYPSNIMMPQETMEERYEADEAAAQTITAPQVVHHDDSQVIQHVDGVVVSERDDQYTQSNIVTLGAKELEVAANSEGKEYYIVSHDMF